MTKLESIKKHGESAQGRKELLSYLKGKPLTVTQAVLARCYDCMSYYADGIDDCESTDCPLYEYMPYRTLSRKKINAAKKKMAKKAKQKKNNNLKKKKSPTKKVAHPLKEKLPVKAKKRPEEKIPKVSVRTDTPSKNKPSKTPVQQENNVKKKVSKKRAPQHLPLF